MMVSSTGHVLMGINDKKIYELPGGRRDPGEKSAFITACRETKEETGIDIRGPAPRELIAIPSPKGFYISFIARVDIDEKFIGELTAEMKCEWINPKALPANIRDRDKKILCRARKEIESVAKNKPTLILRVYNNLGTIPLVSLQRLDASILD